MIDLPFLSESGKWGSQTKELQQFFSQCFFSQTGTHTWAVAHTHRLNLPIENIVKYVLNAEHSELSKRGTRA